MIKSINCHELSAKEVSSEIKKIDKEILQKFKEVLGYGSGQLQVNVFKRRDGGLGIKTTTAKIDTVTFENTEVDNLKKFI